MSTLGLAFHKNVEVKTKILKPRTIKICRKKGLIYFLQRFNDSRVSYKGMHFAYRRVMEILTGGMRESAM